MIEEALSRYSMINPNAILIRHNENMTYKVVDDRGTYLLRIHRAAEGLDFSLNYNDTERKEFISSEIDLLNKLNNDKSHIFQCPIKNVDGEYLTQLTNGDLVTVLTWIDGETLAEKDITSELVNQIGKMIGELHQKVETFSEIKRCRYDEIYMDKVIYEIKKAYNLNHINESSYQSIVKVLSIIKQIIIKEKHKFIWIHSDLSKSNIIYSEFGLSPIDFSLSGYGLREMELGQIIAGFNINDLTSSLIEGYISICDYKVNLDYINLFKALSVILYIVIHHNKVYQDDKFIKGMKRWCETIFMPLIENEVLYVRLS